MQNAENKPKKELIREAAVHVFSKSGFHSTNMPAIAQAAEVAVGTIYHYFESKQDILIYIFRKEIESKKSFFEELSKRGLSKWEKLGEVLQIHFERAKENRELTKVLLMETLAPDKGLHKELRQLREEMAGYISSIVEEGIQKGELSTCDPTITAYAFLGIIESVTARGVLYDDEKANTILNKAPQELVESIKRWLKKDTKSDNQCLK